MIMMMMMMMMLFRSRVYNNNNNNNRNSVVICQNKASTKRCRRAKNGQQRCAVTVGRDSETFFLATKEVHELVTVPVTVRFAKIVDVVFFFLGRIQTTFYVGVGYQL